MEVFVFSILTTLVSLTATVLVVMFIVRGVNHGQRLRKEAFEKALARGVYDRGLLVRRSSGQASLGWGIFFTAVGVAMLIGFTALHILADAATGALIPLFVGIGLIIFYAITRRGRTEQTNGEPITIPQGGTTVVSEHDGSRSEGD